MSRSPQKQVRGMAIARSQVVAENKKLRKENAILVKAIKEIQKIFVSHRAKHGAWCIADCLCNDVPGVFYAHVPFTILLSSQEDE